MTYEEFKEIIERTGEYQVSDILAIGTAVYKKEDILCQISKIRPFGINTIYSENEDFFKEHLDTIVEFAKTPIEDRYPVKKYYVKLIAPGILSDDKIYLNKVVSNIEPTQKMLYQLGHGYSKWKGGLNYISEFTMEEIEEIIPEKDRNKFEYIPVEEED